MKQLYNLFILTMFIFFNINIMYSQNDLAITATTLTQDQYTKIPLSQVSMMAIGGVIENVGTAESTNAVLTISVFDSSSSVVYTESSNPQSIIAGSSLSISFTGFTPTTEETYTTTYTVTLNETDQNTANNTTSSTIEVTANTYARDSDIVTLNLGFGMGTSGQIGQQYDIINQTDLFSVEFKIDNTSGSLNGTTTFVTIWDMVSNIPNSIVAQTETVTINDNVDQMYTANIIGGSYTLAPGTYVIVVNEDSTQNNIALSGTNDIFTPETVWARINEGAWDYIENFGFSNTFIIRPNFQDSTLSISDNQINSDSVNIYPNPSKSFIKINGHLENVNYSIYNVLGNKISNGIISKNERLDIQSFSNGLYFLKFENGKTLKFLKE